jgi:DNA-directed RNA polymerase sigma subunit (sigma70/sigma32)
LTPCPRAKREVLEGRFGLHDREPETLEVLSDRLGLTRERVRQIQNEAMLKLQRNMERNGISTSDAVAVAWPHEQLARPCLRHRIHP